MGKQKGRRGAGAQGRREWKSPEHRSVAPLTRHLDCRRRRHPDCPAAQRPPIPCAPAPLRPCAPPPRTPDRALRARRGVALLDALLGGVMLGIGLAVVLSLASRSVAAQVQGQRQIVASWLLDELLSMVLVEGPQYYGKLHPTAGRFDEPFQDFEFDVEIDDVVIGRPYKVTATVSWEHAGRRREVQAQTYLAERKGDPLEHRAPDEPIDRLGRWYGEE